MSTLAGRAYVSVQYEKSSLSSLESVTRRSAGGLESSWKGAAARAGRAIGLGLAAGGVVAAVGIGKAIQAAGDFQKQLNILQAVSGATSDQMKRISDESIALGKDMKLPATSAQDAALAMTELAKGGLSVKDSMRAARGALELAVAGQTDVATAASITATSLNQFSLSGKEGVYVADLLANAANASAGNVTDFAEGLKYAGTSAHAAGQKIAVVVAALAEMANKGLAGSVAGSSLAQALRSLQAPSSKASDELKKFGLNIYDAAGKMKPLDQIANIFSAHLGNLTQKQQNATLATIFGSRAIQAARVVFLGGGAALDKYTKRVDQVGGAQRLAAAQMKGFSGAIQGFTSNIETLAIQLGLKLLPVATRVVRALSNIASAVGSGQYKVAIGIVWSGVGKVYDSLKSAILGETQTTSLGTARAKGVKVPLTIQRIGLAQEIGSAIASGLKGVNWKAAGATVAAAFASGLHFTTSQAAALVDSLTSGIIANKDKIAFAAGSIGLAMLSTLLDPSFWAANWKTVFALAITVLPVADIAGIGGRIGLFLVRPLGRVIERLLPDAAKTAIFAIETLFRTGFARIGARILSTLRGEATRFPTYFNRAFVLVEDIGSRIISSLGGKIKTIFSSVFGSAEKSGEQAMHGISGAILRAVSTVGKFLLKFTLVKGAVDAVAGAFSTVWQWIKDIISKVEELGSKLASLPSHIPGAGLVSSAAGFIAAHTATGGVTAQSGWQWTGERGPELEWKPRGSVVVPLDRLPPMTEASAGGGFDVYVHNYFSDQKLSGLIDTRVEVKQRKTARRLQAGVA